MSAGCNALITNVSEGTASCSSGNTAGIGPIVGASFSYRTPSREPATRAARGAGSQLANLTVHNTAVARAAAATRRACGSTLPMMSDSAYSDGMAPPGTAGKPRSGAICTSKMVKPIPDKTPATAT